MHPLAMDPAVVRSRADRGVLRTNPVGYGPDLQLKLERRFGMTSLFPDQYIYVVDHAAKKVVYARGFGNVLGYNDSVIDLDLIVGMWHPDDTDTLTRFAEIITQTMWDVQPPLQPFEISFMVDHRARKASGEYIKVLRQTSVFEVDDRTGRPLSTLSICRDISLMKSSSSISWQCTGRGSEVFNKRMVKQKLSNLCYQPSKRELEVIQKLVNGQGSKQVADELGISVSTVQTHRRNILERTDMKNTAELVRRAVEQGWA